MTSELASDVPIPYVGVSITDFFAPELPFEKKKRAAMVAISNCGAKSFRLKAFEKMQELGIQVDSYGYCNHNKDFPGKVVFPFFATLFEIAWYVLSLLF